MSLKAYQETLVRTERLPAGVAPHVSSTQFRCHDIGNRSKARSWDHRLSTEALGHGPSVLKQATKVMNNSSKPMISLGIARPSSEYYPWESMTLCTRDSKLGQESTKIRAFDSRTSMSCSRGEDAFDLAVALNYGFAAGSPQLLRFMTEHIEFIHKPPYADWETVLNCSTTSALDIVFRILCNRGDWIIAEEFSYSGALNAMKGQGLNVLGVRMDEDGLIPDDLESKLEDWDPAKGKKPFVLYIIPTGHNPTGITQSPERRRATYAVAERHDLYIIEDDPYFFLQLGAEPAHRTSSDEHNESSIENYLAQLPPSYLSIDISGRVLRMDTSSKILAPGLRCGWMTGCAQIIEKFLLYSELSTIAPSGPSQVMLYKLLDETWGHDGFFRWLHYLSLQYRNRRDILLEACTQHLPKNICRWDVPSGGMFLWVRIKAEEHSDVYSLRPSQTSFEDEFDLEEQIYQMSRANGVLVSKGSWFCADQGCASDVAFRITFAAAPEDVLDEAVKRFGDAVRTVLGPNMDMKLASARET